MFNNVSMRKDTIFAVRIPQELKDAINAAAEAEMRSPGNFVTKVLTDYLRGTGYLSGPGGRPTKRKDR